MPLKQAGFTYSASGLFTINKKRIQKFKETRDTSYIYKNELDKAFFHHDMAYGYFKDLAKRTASNKVLSDKAFNIGKNPKYFRYQRGIASMVYNFFDRKSSGSGVNIQAMSNEQLGKELHKRIIRKFKKRTLFSGSKGNIWGADLADMQLISKFDKIFRFLLCDIDNFSKYAWVAPLKVKEV